MAFRTWARRVNGEARVVNTTWLCGCRGLKVRDKQARIRIAGVNVENKEKMEGLACQTEVRGNWLALLYLQTNIGCRGVSDMHAGAKAPAGPVPR